MTGRTIFFDSSQYYVVLRCTGCSQKLSLPRAKPKECVLCKADGRYSTLVPAVLRLLEAEGDYTSGY